MWMSEERFPLAARLIHWIMAPGFVSCWGGWGYAMTTLVEDDSPREALLVGLHIPVGVTLLARLALRIALRLAYRPPPLPDSIRGMERAAAHLGHAAIDAGALRASTHGASGPGRAQQAGRISRPRAAAPRCRAARSRT